MTQELEVPDLEWPEPPCSICGDDTTFDDGRYICYPCEISWDATTHGSSESTNEHRCLHTRTDGNSRCIRSIDHPNPITGHVYE